MIEVDEWPPFGGLAWHDDTASQDASRAAAIADAEDASP